MTHESERQIRRTIRKLQEHFGVERREVVLEVGAGFAGAVGLKPRDAKRLGIKRIRILTGGNCGNVSFPW